MISPTFLPPDLAVIVKGYPRLSETFIANEIRGLERRGARILIVSLRHPTDLDRHPVHEKIEAETLYLPEYLHHEPGRVLRALRAVWRRPGFGRASRTFLRDLSRDMSRNRVRRFGQALVLAHEAPHSVRRLHAHFLHTPSSVAMYAAAVLHLPWSASAHAKDIWTTPAQELSRKLADAAWVVTCTDVNRRYLESLRPDGAPGVARIYHGLGKSDNPVPARPARNGGDPANPVALVSVGRCVPKKGYRTLLDALARLDPGLHWRLVHVGGGPEAEALKRRGGALGLSDRIDWRGPQPQQGVVAAYGMADIFVLPCEIAADGDRDGLPNVLMEAQRQGLPCVSTDISGIPELIEDGVTGLLVPERDAAALASALTRLMREPVRREALGRAGRARVDTAFRASDGYDEIWSRLRPATQRSKVA